MRKKLAANPAVTNAGLKKVEVSLPEVASAPNSATPFDNAEPLHSSRFSQKLAEAKASQKMRLSSVDLGQTESVTEDDKAA